MGKSKKELDRDSMFRKIIPALANNPFSDFTENMALLSDEIPESADSHNTAPTLPEEDSHDTAPTLPEEDNETNELSALRARLFARSDTLGAGLDPVSTINLMESLVLTHLDEVIQRFNCCRCDRCRRDIAAFALTHLPAQYIVAAPQHIEQIEQRIPKKMVLEALVKAVIQVRMHPRH